jgi:hypothetical protein
MKIDEDVSGDSPIGRSPCLTVRPEDLDHPRALIGQIPCTDRRRNGVLEGDDNDAVKWTH